VILASLVVSMLATRIDACGVFQTGTMNIDPTGRIGGPRRRK
jgi:hypothetical protein